MVSLRTILAVPILLGLTATALPNPASPLNNDLAVPHTSNLNTYNVREIHLDHAQGDADSDGFAGGRTILRKPGYPDITLMGEGTSFTGFVLFEEVKEQDQGPPSHLNVYQARITISEGGNSRYSHCPRDTSWDTDTPMQGETRITENKNGIRRTTIIKNGIKTVYLCNNETNAVGHDPSPRELEIINEMSRLGQEIGRLAAEGRFGEMEKAQEELERKGQELRRVGEAERSKPNNTANSHSSTRLAVEGSGRRDSGKGEFGDDGGSGGLRRGNRLLIYHCWHAGRIRSFITDHVPFLHVAS
ncbi:hypothetical protein QBC37DRAFT_483197 [Rhypophila decipiens]|uniref:Uncharacterized protein n=1 Tax=Rhypophila decipiens TaxID=261697 RepID=A0AAN6Y691_9PEZI|nr:hypothetical protein QBC37DRAFT_483197 [Rhypophila decipiens]